MKRFFLLFVLALTSCKQANNENLTKSEIDSILKSVDTSVVEMSKPKIDSVKINELKKYFSFDRDEFDAEKLTWVKPLSSPKYTNLNGLYCYFAQIDGKPSNFRFRLQYLAEDWLFIERCEFLVDDKPFSFIPTEVKRDNGDGDIWEWFDEQINLTNLDLIEALSNAKTAKIKLIGTQYHDIINISPKQLLNINRSYQFYIASGGSFSSY